MRMKTNADGRKGIGVRLRAIGWIAVIVIIPATAWFLPTDNLQLMTLWILPALFVALIFAYIFMWLKERVLAVRWGLLNHVLPLIFILLPPLFVFLIFGQGTTLESGFGKIDSVSELFSPTYYSLMVAVSFTFIVLLFELQDYIGATSEKVIGSPEMNRLHSFSTFCLLAALAAALLYALPYVLDLRKLLSEEQQTSLFILATIVAVSAPLGAILIYERLGSGLIKEIQ
uniref:Uncharacterized protein n=1 Tax=Candidatus Kentrum sp. FW TaxID=2126338 RepID=A0A450U2B8_9GAMM|nr:MAG: hypothetical protein BECKFW1821C_GA0114237_11161 [Candidatus Kentron sp. FW]